MKSIAKCEVCGGKIIQAGNGNIYCEDCSDKNFGKRLQAVANRIERQRTMNPTKKTITMENLRKLVYREYLTPEEREEAVNEFEELIGKFPEPQSNEMQTFLLVNALRLLSDDQQAKLCFDLYLRLENKNLVNQEIKKLNL